jgi:hypothetical protein
MEKVEAGDISASGGSSNCEQLFEKSSDLTCTVNKVNLEDPVAFLTLWIEVSHPIWDCPDKRTR